MSNGSATKRLAAAAVGAVVLAVLSVGVSTAGAATPTVTAAGSALPNSRVTVNQRSDGPVFLIDKFRAVRSPRGCVQLSLSGKASEPLAKAPTLDLGAGAAPFDTVLTPDPGGFSTDDRVDQRLCVLSGGGLTLRFTVQGDPKEFTAPVGEVSFIQSAGLAYDRVKFDNAMNAFNDPVLARDLAAVPGAVVSLQRLTGASFTPVAADDRGLAPALAEETTGSDGHFQWSARAGTYRVAVRASGYRDAVSPATRVAAAGDPLTALDVALEPLDAPPPTPTPTGGAAAGGAGGTGGGDILILRPEDLPHPPPPPPLPTGDTFFSGVGFTTRVPVDRKGVATFTLRCPAVEQVCAGAVGGQTVVPRAANTGLRSTATAKKQARPESIGSVPFRVGGGTTTKLKAKLPRKVFKLVKRDRLLRVRLAVNATDAVGNQTTTKAEVTLRVGASKKKKAKR